MTRLHAKGSQLYAIFCAALSAFVRVRWVQWLRPKGPLCLAGLAAWGTVEELVQQHAEGAEWRLDAHVVIALGADLFSLRSTRALTAGETREAWWRPDDGRVFHALPFEVAPPHIEVRLTQRVMKQLVIEINAHSASGRRTMRQPTVKRAMRIASCTLLLAGQKTGETDKVVCNIYL